MGLFCLFLSVAKGQRPRNYLCCCCCWIFHLIYALETSTTMVHPIFIIFENFTLIYHSIYLCIYLSTCLPTPIYEYLPTSTYLPAYAYPPSPTYLHLPFAAVNISTRTLKIAKVSSKICQILNRPKKFTKWHLVALSPTHM